MSFDLAKLCEPDLMDELGWMLRQGISRQWVSLRHIRLYVRMVPGMTTPLPSAPEGLKGRLMLANWELGPGHPVKVFQQALAVMEKWAAGEAFEVYIDTVEPEIGAWLRHQGYECVDATAPPSAWSWVNQRPLRAVPWDLAQAVGMQPEPLWQEP